MSNQIWQNCFREHSSYTTSTKEIKEEKEDGGQNINNIDINWNSKHVWGQVKIVPCDKRFLSSLLIEHRYW